MSDILPLTIGVLPTHNHYGLRNTQALAGVSHVWQDFFARALAEQLGDTPQALAAKAPPPKDPAVEPSEGADLLSQILTQRECDVKDTEIAPPEPLFLPIAELETELLPPPATPFPPDELVAQQRQQNFESGWVRPLVLNAGQPQPEPGPAPEPRPLHLPIAEFELDLLPPAAVPYPADELVAQQKALDFDYHWARPLVLNNLRLAA
ncbi:energy transducer TonB [Pseudomonas sp. B22129]|uniref:energy transducer TonB n=1 Tax=Pseudomonas sp. B22129 TaxID=3235111 RepID=UPI0037833D2E